TAPIVAFSAGGAAPTATNPAAPPDPNPKLSDAEAQEAKRKAHVIGTLVGDYLNYRERLRHASEPELRKDRIEQKSGPPIPVGPPAVPPMVRVPVVPVAVD